MPESRLQRTRAASDGISPTWNARRQAHYREGELLFCFLCEAPQWCRYDIVRDNFLGICGHRISTELFDRAKQAISSLDSSVWIVPAEEREQNR